MSDNYIEKSFLYLIALSILLHVAIFLLIVYLPQEKKVPRQEPYMVELRDLPPGKEPVREEKEVQRLAEQRQRVAREAAPRGEAARETAPARQGPAVPPAPPQPAGERGAPPRPAERGEVPLKERPGGDFFRRKEQSAPDITTLYPSAQKLARIEEEYRKKYEPEVEEGEARFLNTDDIQFGSFLRRFESAVYGVWRYPPDAARMGIEGVVPTRITFNRKGEIEKLEILEGGSGSMILDDEVRRALKLLGPVGGFPKGYGKDTFNLIAFFHYGIVRGQVRGTLR
ncbi:MAG TPA: TonB family protein [Geobacteraceae bacterium]